MRAVPLYPPHEFHSNLALDVDAGFTFNRHRMCAHANTRLVR